ncbi:MAG TPA: DUF2911 domain-containing protein [Chitinophagales bacterium]|nr:DUF2911 domain-containing protein [Chitinophagales bacterium]HRX24534.1 DUF2911 domain-containing protein [Chitinophagales bacterium]
MKRLELRLPLLIGATILAGVLQAQQLPMPSPYAEIEQTIGLAEIEIEYSRPSMKGRTIFGDLVPYGEIWRTGANKCVQLEVSDPIMVNGNMLDSGKYSLFTIPGEKEWTIIINTNTELWGAGGYSQEQDVMRFNVPSSGMAETAESFTIDFSNITPNTADCNIYWERTRVSFPIEHDYREKAMANIKEALSKEDAPFGAWESAAEFYIDHDLDKKKALEMAKKSVELKEVFWNVYTLSRAFDYNGMRDEALQAARRSLELAEEAQYKTYIDLNKKNIEAWSK